MFNFIKNLFRKVFTPAVPTVTRLMVLQKAKEFKRAGLCYSIRDAMMYYDLIPHALDPTFCFPLFTRRQALSFGAKEWGCYWWKPCVWDTGREAFLDWLIEQYKDDKTDLRTL